MFLLAEYGENVTGRQDQIILALYLDLGAAVLRVEDDITDGDVERDPLAVLVFARAHGQYFTQLGLFLRGIGDDEAASCAGLVLVLRLDHNAVPQRLEIHPTFLLQELAVGSYDC